MKIKNLRKMVSVILCVIISCMCFATPACAAGKSEASVMGTNTPNIGIQRICMYPGFIDSDGTLYVGDPAVSNTVTNGTDILNLTVDAYTQYIYTSNNCNCWVLDIYYCSDNNVSYIDFKVNGEIFASKSQTTSS